VLSEIPVDFEPRAEAALRAALAQSRLMLLGEVHGVEENPAVIYTLFRRFEFAALALEWPSSIDLRNPMLSADGRITPRHFELLDQLGREGRLEHLTLFDSAGDGTWSGRDLAMARALMAGRRQDLTTLVVAGNLHTKTRPLQYGHPMGEHVAAQVPAVPSGRIHYLDGHYYNFGVKRFRRRFWHRGRRPARFYLKDGEFVFDIPNAHAAGVG
jgi:hypothetical protein